MRFATVEQQGRQFVAVEVDDETIVDIDELLLLASDAVQSPRIQSMKQIISAGKPLRKQIEAALANIHNLDAELLTHDSLRWLPPVVNPGKVCCVAMNNSASNARKISAPNHPAYFLKPPSCFIGHRETIVVRPYYGSVHPEPELAAVIGKEMRDIPAVNALEYIFGYTIVNDITGNGMRAEDMFHYWAVYAKTDNPAETTRVEQHLSYAARYKGTDTFGVMGPWLVTADAVPNPDDLNVECRLGAETIAEDSTRYYNYKVAEILSFLSYFQTLKPGDIVSLGTAFKAAPGRKSIHHANLQNHAEPISITIDHLGTQESDVAVEDKPLGPWRLS